MQSSRSRKTPCFSAQKPARSAEKRCLNTKHACRRARSSVWTVLTITVAGGRRSLYTTNTKSPDQSALRFGQGFCINASKGQAQKLAPCEKLYMLAVVVGESWRRREKKFRRRPETVLCLLCSYYNCGKKVPQAGVGDIFFTFLKYFCFIAFFVSPRGACGAGFETLYSRYLHNYCSSLVHLLDVILWKNVPLEDYS